MKLPIKNHNTNDKDIHWQKRIGENDPIQAIIKVLSGKTYIEDDLTSKNKLKEYLRAITNITISSLEEKPGYFGQLKKSKVIDEKTREVLLQIKEATCYESFRDDEKYKRTDLMTILSNIDKIVEPYKKSSDKQKFDHGASIA